MKLLIATTIAALGLMGHAYLSPAANTAQLEEDGRWWDARTAAIMDCMRNTAYDRSLLGQCLDDWFDANAHLYNVDH